MPTGADKAAILLSRMPPDVVEAVLGKIDPERAGRLRAQLQELHKAPQSPQVTEQILLEMRDLLRSARQAEAAAKKPDPLADEFVPSAAAPGPEVAAAPPPAPEPKPAPPPATDDAVADLRQLDPAILAAALRDERVPTVTLALGCLPAARAGEVLKLLAQDVRREVALRLGLSAERNPELMRAVARAVVVKARSLAERAEDIGEDAQVRKLADLLRSLERDDRKEVLDALTAREPAMGEKVKKLLYEFRDLLRVENRCLQGLLAKFDMKTLALALRGSAPEVEQKVLTNLSTRAREALAEEVALLGTVPPSTLRDAQAKVVAELERLDNDGKLVMLD